MRSDQITKETRDMSMQLTQLKPGKHFTVASVHDRNMVLHAAKVLFSAGAINFEIMTAKSRDGIGFDVIRLPFDRKNKGKENTKA